MNDIQYLQTQKQMLEVAQALNALDLDTFIERGKLALSVGPIFNPTLYRCGADNLIRIMAMARAARHLANEYNVFLM